MLQWLCKSAFWPFFTMNILSCCLQKDKLFDSPCGAISFSANLVQRLCFRWCFINEAWSERGRVSALVIRGRTRIYCIYSKKCLVSRVLGTCFDLSLIFLLQIDFIIHAAAAVNMVYPYQVSAYHHTSLTTKRRTDNNSVSDFWQINIDILFGQNFCAGQSPWSW